MKITQGINGTVNVTTVKDGVTVTVNMTHKQAMKIQQEMCQ